MERKSRPGLWTRVSEPVPHNSLGAYWLNIPNSDLVFNVPQIVSFLSQGTTLPAGTIILTGTPPGVGHAMNPKQHLREGDEFHVELLPHVGTLITNFENQK